MTQPDAELAGTLAARLDRASQARLGRSLALYVVQAGDCGGCALELQALRGVAYRLGRLGLSFVTTPRHADVLLVAGALTRVLAGPVRLAWEAAAEPKFVVAVGDCAVSGGRFKSSYAVLGGVAEAVPVDVAVAGCPPPPAAILGVLASLIEANV